MLYESWWDLVSVSGAWSHCLLTISKEICELKEQSLVPGRVRQNFSCCCSSLAGPTECYVLPRVTGKTTCFQEGAVQSCSRKTRHANMLPSSSSIARCGFLSHSSPVPTSAHWGAAERRGLLTAGTMKDSVPADHVSYNASEAKAPTQLVYSCKPICLLPQKPHYFTQPVSSPWLSTKGSATLK